MSRVYSFAPEARAELLEAVQYYESESPGLGSAFLSAVNEGIEQLLAFPEASPVLYGKVRRNAIRRFPYNLLYSLRAQEIRILAVMHHRRRPFYWLDRR